MFCPNCKSEYVISARVCADCHVPLVPGLPGSIDPQDAPDWLTRLFLWLQKVGRLLLSQPDPSGLGPDDLVDIISTEKPGDLAAIQSILKAHGIEHVIADCEEPDDHRQATIHKRVMVRGDKLSEARMALKDLLKIAHREQQRAEDEWYMKVVVFAGLVFLLGFFVVLLVMAALGVRWP